MGWGSRNNDKLSVKEIKAAEKQAKANRDKEAEKRTKALVKERDARRAREQAEARKKAAKTVTGNPSHYQQASGRGASARGRDGHHGD